jgi:hypothetical protein
VAASNRLRAPLSLEKLVYLDGQHGVLLPPVEGKLVRGSESLDVGDRVRATLVRTDVQRRFIDFARSGEASPRP